MKKTRMLCAVALMLSMMLYCMNALADAQTVTGTASGMGAVSVELTVEDGRIVSAVVDTSNETPGYGMDIADELAAQLVDAQSAQIDGVSGCTITTTAVQTAAAQAMAEAGMAAEGGAMTPGVYVGTGRGAKSDIKVAVQVSEDGIVNVWPVESDDTAMFSKIAINTVAERIVDEQSLAVDVVGGATLSSRGTILAVSDAMRQAGADIAAWSVAEPKEKVQRETEEFDVVVVGGGTSGLTAALSAKTNSELGIADSGLRVLVVERNGFVGGDMGYSGGYIATPSGNPLSEATGVEMSPEDVCRNMLAANPNAADFANEALSLNVWKSGPATIKGLMARGFFLTLEDARVVPLGDGMITAAFTHDPVTGYRNGDDWYDAMTGAPYEGATLGHLVADAGVEIRVSTEATGLIVEDNVCTGIMVEDADSVYQINAKKVILATGYGGFDAESIEMFYPELSNVFGANNAGNHSDAQKWIKELGGEVIYYPDANYIVPVFNAILRDNYEVGYLFQKVNTLWVNSNGERFFDESEILTNSLTDTGALLRTTDDGRAFIVFGSDNAECAQYAPYLMEQGAAWSGATVEELAANAGLPVDALAAAVEEFNAACEGDTVAVAGDTLYAARIMAGSTASVPLSVYADEDMTVTLTKGGQRIENLLAAGGACGNMVPVTGFGAHVYEALASGTYAGECARAALLGE